MTLKSTPPSPELDACLSAALMGLHGAMLCGLRKLPQPEALSILDAVQTGVAAFVWSVEAQEEIASVKLELAHVTGPRKLLSVVTVSLVLTPPCEPVH